MGSLYTIDQLVGPKNAVLKLMDQIDIGSQVNAVSMHFTLFWWKWDRIRKNAGLETESGYADP